MPIECHPTISSSVTFSFYLQSFPAPGPFPMRPFLHQVAKVLELLLQHESCQWVFRFDLLTVQGALKSSLLHFSSKASFLQCSAFFMIQLSHKYMTTRTTVALTIQTFVGKVMSLLFNMLSMFIIAFLPRSNHLLISWFQSPSTVILEPKKRKSIIASTFSPSICYEVMGVDTMIYVFFNIEV